MSATHKIAIICLIWLVAACADISASSKHLDDASYVVHASEVNLESTLSVEEVVHGGELEGSLDVSSHLMQASEETPYLFITIRSNMLVQEKSFPVFDIAPDRYEFLSEWIEEHDVEFYIDYSTMDRTWVPISCRKDLEKCQNELDVLAAAYQRAAEKLKNP